MSKFYNQGTKCLLICALLFFATSSSAQLTYWVDQSVKDSPYEAKIREIMDYCVAEYNKYSNYNKHVKVIYKASIPTANASYNGRIAFGGQRTKKTALHEMSHVLGVGTYWKWNNNRNGKIWTGTAATALIKQYNGPDAVLKADKHHMWPYGLNKKWENVQRHVYMVGAVRQDMGLSNTSGQGTAGNARLEDNETPIEISDIAEDLSLFPIPTDKYLNISGISTDGILNVYNVQGKRVISAPFTEVLDVSSLIPGVYALKIEGYPTQRFIKK